MLDELEREISVQDLLVLSGGAVHYPTFTLKEYNLVPKNSFRGVDPDESKYEGYFGNVSS